MAFSLQAVAVAADVNLAAVFIARAEALSRRQSESTRVDLTIAAASATAADDVAKRLTAPRINAELKKAGLPEARALEGPRIEEAAPQPLPAGAVAGIVLGSVFGAAMGCFLTFMIYRECRGAPVFPLGKEMQPLVSRTSSDLVRAKEQEAPHPSRA
jgi:hypothetical protein